MGLKMFFDAKNLDKSRIYYNNKFLGMHEKEGNMHYVFKLVGMVVFTLGIFILFAIIIANPTGIARSV